MTRERRRWIGAAFTAVTLAWLLLILLVPAALARDTRGRAVTAVSAGTYLIAGFVCHQRPDRSFHPAGVQMPVCARCAGLYLGAGVGVLAAGVRRRKGAGSGPGRTAGSTGIGQAPAWLRRAVLAAAVPTGISFVAEMAGWIPSIGELRAAAGVPLGMAVTWVASLVIRGDLA